MLVRRKRLAFACLILSVLSRKHLLLGTIQYKSMQGSLLVSVMYVERMLFGVN